jgi:dynein heavy chain 1
VLLKNVHLAPKQLDQLYKKMLQRQLHDNFRLFFSTEINEKLPQGLLMNANSFTFEPAAGVKESLKRTLNSFSEEEMQQEPAERSRMYLLVAWLHAVIQERLRYTPLGWSKKYEFGEPDLRAAIYTVNQWMTDEAKGKSNLPPDKIPFAALRELLSKAVYGGRIDNVIDDRLLASFVDTIFTPKAFEYGHPLVADGPDGAPGIKVPEGTKRDQFLVWANELPDKEQPFWIGLPNSAQMVLRANLAMELLQKFLKMQTADEDEAVIDSSSGGGAAQAAPTWMIQMKSNCATWLEKLPEELPELEVTASSIKDPLHRFFNREVSMAVALLKQVRSDLETLLDVCDGNGKLTNYINALRADLIQGMVPKAWMKYTFPGDVTTIVWVADFVERCRQYTRIGEHAKAGKNLRTAKVWLGGLMEPSAFFTASRQAIAQLSGISLEQLHMEISAGSSGDDKALTLINLRFEGSKSANGELSQIEEMHITEETSELKWIAGDTGYSSAERVRLPIYLNCARTQFLDTIDFKASAGSTEGNFYEKGAAIICSALGGVA